MEFDGTGVGPGTLTLCLTGGWAGGQKMYVCKQGALPPPHAELCKCSERAAGSVSVNKARRQHVDQGDRGETQAERRRRVSLLL